MLLLISNSSGKIYEDLKSKFKSESLDNYYIPSILRHFLQKYISANIYPLILSATLWFFDDNIFNTISSLSPFLSPELI